MEDLYNYHIRFNTLFKNTQLKNRPENPQKISARVFVSPSLLGFVCVFLVFSAQKILAW